jgi:hypothetical protein
MVRMSHAKKPNRASETIAETITTRPVPQAASITLVSLMLALYRARDCDWEYEHCHVVSARFNHVT